MSYRRLKTALEQIAAGAADPAAVAAEALRDRRPPPKPWHEPPPKKYDPQAAVDRLFSFYSAWLEAGKPKFTVYGKAIGLSGGRVGQKIARAKRSLAHPSRKDHPLRRIAWPE